MHTARVVLNFENPDNHFQTEWPEEFSIDQEPNLSYQSSFLWNDFHTPSSNSAADAKGKIYGEERDNLTLVEKGIEKQAEMEEAWQDFSEAK